MKQGMVHAATFTATSIAGAAADRVSTAKAVVTEAILLHPAPQHTVVSIMGL